MTNRVVILAFSLIGITVLAGLGLAHILGRQAYYFMPGSGVSSWKLLLLGMTTMTASLMGIVLQVLTYRQVKELYRAHPSLKQTDRHLFQVRYQQSSRIHNHLDCVTSVTPVTQQYTKMEKSRASRLDLEAGFYYFVISIPVLISNGTIGLFLTFNYICSYTELASYCHRLDIILLYIRTIQLFITACNPIVYFALSSEFRSACQSKFGTLQLSKTR